MFNLNLKHWNFAHSRRPFKLLHSTHFQCCSLYIYAVVSKNAIPAYANSCLYNVYSRLRCISQLRLDYIRLHWITLDQVLLSSNRLGYVGLAQAKPHQLSVYGDKLWHCHWLHHIKTRSVRHDVLTAVMINVTALWGMTPCRLAQKFIKVSRKPAAPSSTTNTQVPPQLQ
jgi:hypothetical protein